MAAGDITHAEVVGTLLTGTLATLYTVPASQILLGLEIAGASVDTAATQYPEAQLIPSGQSAGDRYVLFRRMSLGGNGILPGGKFAENFDPMSAAGGYIQMRNTDGAAGAGTTDKIAVHIGVTLKEV